MDNDQSSATLTQRIQPPSALGLEMQQQTAWTAEKLESTTSGTEVCTLWITKKNIPKVTDHQNRNRSNSGCSHFPCFGLAGLASCSQDQKEQSNGDELDSGHWINCSTALVASHKSTGLGMGCVELEFPWYVE